MKAVYAWLASLYLDSVLVIVFGLGQMMPEDATIDDFKMWPAPCGS